MRIPFLERPRSIAFLAVLLPLLPYEALFVSAEAKTCCIASAQEDVCSPGSKKCRPTSDDCPCYGSNPGKFQWHSKSGYQTGCTFRFEVGFGTNHGCEEVRWRISPESDHDCAQEPPCSGEPSVMISWHESGDISQEESWISGEIGVGCGKKKWLEVELTYSGGSSCEIWAGWIWCCTPTE